MLLRPRSGLLGFVALVVLAGPGHAQQANDSAATAQAASAADTWLLLVDNGDYDASWDQAAPAFQQAVSKADWGRSVTQARIPFEPFGARRLAKAEFQESLPNAPPGPYVILQYRTSVSQNRTVTETVVPMRQADGRWMVAGYFVRPEN
jgi:Protein of unknown function (DUF4019)